IKFKLNDICSVAFSEAFAIRKSLKKILYSKEINYALFTDSLSVINGIRNPGNKEPIILDIINLIREIQNNKKTIKIIWIPSHIGIQGNEQADKAAKEATALDDICTVAHPVSHHDLYNSIQKQITNKWNYLWSSNPLTKLHIVRNSIFEKIPYNTTNRRDQVILTRLRIGHSRLTHSHLFTHNSPALCQHCNIRITIPHILAECPAYHQSRIKYNIPPDICISLKNKTILPNIIKYVNELNLRYLL
ncbi:hypothetical protein X777_06662, partial [Ooceraea biroi]